MCSKLAFKLQRTANEYAAKRSIYKIPYQQKYTLSRHTEFCKAARATWILTLQGINMTPKEQKTERGRSRRRLFRHFCGSSIRLNKQRGSSVKFPQITCSNSFKKWFSISTLFSCFKNDPGILHYLVTSEILHPPFFIFNIFLLTSTTTKILGKMHLLEKNEVCDPLCWGDRKKMFLSVRTHEKINPSEE